MDREARRRLEEYRRNEAGPFENTLIDEYADGEFDRRELLRRASVLGVSVPVVGARPNVAARFIANSATTAIASSACSPGSSRNRSRARRASVSANPTLGPGEPESPPVGTSVALSPGRSGAGSPTTCWRRAGCWRCRAR